MSKLILLIILTTVSYHALSESIYIQQSMPYLPKVDRFPLIKNDRLKFKMDIHKTCLKRGTPWREKTTILGFKIVFIRNKGWIKTDFTLADRGEAGNKYELNTDKKMISYLKKEVESKIELDIEQIEKYMKMVQDKFKIVQFYFYI